VLTHNSNLELVIVNERRKWQPAPPREPLPFGYLHLAAAVDPPSEPGLPFPRRSSRRDALLRTLKEAAAELVELDAVEKATVYRAVLVSPSPRNGSAIPVTHPARFDVAVLIESCSPTEIPTVRASAPYRRMEGALREAAQDMHVMAARCGRLIGDVDKSRPGVFLFNHFIAEDPEVALRLWDWLAGWYAAETGLHNSTLLQPIGDADYAFVNHARWDRGLPRLMLDQLARPSFRNFVLANLRANHTQAMPVLYRLA
jgi:hypothetical protein